MLSDDRKDGNLKDWFYRHNQQKETDDFKFTNLDLSFLKQLNDECYCLINICSQVEWCPPVPQGKSLYVMAWFFETFNSKWFLDIYNKNPQAQFVIITDMEPNGFLKLDRVQFFQFFHHSTWIDAIRLKNPGPCQQPIDQRKYKLSSLCSRLNEYKFFITAKLHIEQNPEVYYTWNRDFEIRNEDSFVFEQRNFQQSDELLAKCKLFLRDNKINSEIFDNNPLSNCNFNHPAYSDTVINSVNETQTLSSDPDFLNYPTPYISEKAWKPLFAGNALLFSGQCGLKQKLESWGFKFDYVWAQGYDNSFNDNQRLESILTNINWILTIPRSDLARMAKDSVEHNLELAWSGRLENMFKQHNNHTSEQLKKHLGLV